MMQPTDSPFDSGDPRLPTPPDQAPYDGPSWPAIISRNEAAYRATEAEPFRKALDMYQGKAWTDKDRASREGVALTSFNLVYAIVESACSALIPANLRFSVTEVRGKMVVAPDRAEQALDDACEEGDWQTEARISMTDAVLLGRGVIKVVPCEDEDAEGSVSVRAVRPQQVRFDLTARRTSDISWVAERRLVPLDDAVGYVRDGTWKLPPGYSDARDYFLLTAATWPAALGAEASSASAKAEYAEVWEVWDARRKCMSVWVLGDGGQRPLCYQTFKPAEWALPYVIYNLNFNGENLLGLSEVQLLLDNITAINRFLSWMMAAVRTQVPITLYDANLLAEVTVERVATASPGAFVAVNAAASEKAIGDMFAPAPQATISKDLPDLLAKLESIVQYTSALADAARGQVTGARTATELALIESQQRTRLSSRINAFNQAWGKVAALALWHLENRSSPIRDLLRSTRLVASSASTSNRAVIREQWEKLLGFMRASNDRALERKEQPPFDERRMYDLFADAFSLPDGLLTPEAAETEAHEEEETSLGEDQAETSAAEVMPPGMPMPVPQMPPMPEAAPMPAAPVDPSMVDASYLA